MVAIRRALPFVLAGMIPALAGCAEETYPSALLALQQQAGGGSVDASIALPSGGNDASTATTTPGACRQAHGESLPARLRVMTADAGVPAPTGTTITVDQIFTQFQSTCTPCHTGETMGNFQVANASEFSTKMTPSVLAQVTSDGLPGQPLAMPPIGGVNGKPFHSRAAEDPIVLFANLVQHWFDAGKAPSFFLAGTAMPPPSGDGGVDYTLTAAEGNAMTNIGICVPNKELVDTELSRAQQLDAMFAGKQKVAGGLDVTIDQQLGLPLHLGDTDMFTLDSAELAKTGVIAYAPGYPLWSDNAGKIRHIRVPVGTSVHFDKSTQTFQIPPNTRFYKTFLKPVIEFDNSIRWKKVETRLIVARPNLASDPDSATPPALFGTYLWNDAETDAMLGGDNHQQDRVHDTTFFRDAVLQYTVDEPLAADLLTGQPYDPTGTLLVRKQAARHYAVPSSARCIECHRGSPSRDFVLGFNPLQINRRPTGIGGTIEPTGADELTQLQRFIDYGLITGIDSPGDLLSLEASEGTRAPRNQQELLAQGYMLGNCAHCHNPHGDPSVLNPVLKGVLNFLPGPNGGIFQFPLERFSPRIQRGNSTVVNIPYITPSLLDQPESLPGIRPSSIDPFIRLNGNRDSVDTAVYAPWRSIIYRNVDDAFAYTDDVALFPHMPRNTPGYDPRAKQILSDWMVSLPAVRKHPEEGEFDRRDAIVPSGTVSIFADAEIQPYVEVPPGAPGYDTARRAAQQRLAILHTGVNPDPAMALSAGSTPYSPYADPDDAFDIVDPTVELVCKPIPQHASNPGDPYPFARHPHWVVTDLTDFPGDWTPRGDWASKLVLAQPDDSLTSCSGAPDPIAVATKADETLAVGILGGNPTPTLDSVRDFVTTPLPFGLWQRAGHPTCTFPGQPTVKSFTDCAGGTGPDGGPCTPPPAWMIAARDPKDMSPASPDQLDPSDVQTGMNTPPGTAIRGLQPGDFTPDAPVYMEAPGAAIFKMICINCHGPLADSNGRMAQNLATMTGGGSRVANFRGGLFGPLQSPGAYRDAVFSALPTGAQAPWTTLNTEDIAAHYMAWMALGGTKANIPVDIISLVGTTTVLGARRSIALTGSANMLSNAKQLCASLLGPDVDDVPPITANKSFDMRPGHGYLDTYNARLIRKNGDAELWMRLCSLNNHPFVHVIASEAANELPQVVINGSLQKTQDVILWDQWLASSAARPIGNQSGGVDPVLRETNVWPWCYNPGNAAPLQACTMANCSDTSTSPDNCHCTPMCPPGWLASDDQRPGEPPVHPTVDDAQKWAVRGAINAAFAVFTYLEDLEKRQAPEVDYDNCEALP